MNQFLRFYREHWIWVAVNAFSIYTPLTQHIVWDMCGIRACVCMHFIHAQRSSYVIWCCNSNWQANKYINRIIAERCFSSHAKQCKHKIQILTAQPNNSKKSRKIMWDVIRHTRPHFMDTLCKSAAYVVVAVGVIVGQHDISLTKQRPTKIIPIAK